jgi:hypothetical protein
MRDFTHDAVIEKFLATSRWYLLEARVTMDGEGRVKIEPPSQGLQPQVPLPRPPQPARPSAAAT